MGNPQDLEDVESDIQEQELSNPAPADLTPLLGLEHSNAFAESANELEDDKLAREFPPPVEKQEKLFHTQEATEVANFIDWMETEYKGTESTREDMTG